MGKRSKKAVHSKLARGDLIAAKFRTWPYWPAVISQVYKNYVTVFWLPNNLHRKQGHRVPLKNVSDFKSSGSKKAENAELKEANEMGAEFVNMKPEERLARFASPDPSPVGTSKGGKRPLAQIRTAGSEKKKKTRTTEDNNNGGQELVRDLYSKVKQRRRSSPEGETPLIDGQLRSEGKATDSSRGRKSKRKNSTDISPSTETGKLSRTETETETKTETETETAATSTEETALCLLGMGTERTPQSGDGPDKTDPDTDTDEFPSFSPMSSLSSENAGHQEYKRGDVVWAKYMRWDPWPSLVLDCNPKTKKLKVEFLPVNKHRPFNIALKNIQPYREHYFQNYTSMGNIDLVHAVQQAEKILGKIIDPFVPDPPSGLTEDNKPVEETKTKEDDEEESGEGSRTESPKDHRELSAKTLARIERRKAKNQRLIECLTSEETKDHLLLIANGQARNGRQEEWERVGAAMVPPCSFGPIIDEDQIEDLFEVLSTWYQQDFDSNASIRNTFTYVSCVWLPEAVKFAAIRTLRYSEEKVEKMMSEPPKYLDEEMLEVRQELQALPSSDCGTPFDQLVAAACQEREKEDSE